MAAASKVDRLEKGGIGCFGPHVAATERALRTGVALVEFAFVLVGAFFHDGDVGGEVGVEDVLEAEAPEGGVEIAGVQATWGFAQSAGSSEMRQFSNDWKIFFQWLEKLV